MFGGPDPELLFRPSDAVMAAIEETLPRLAKLAEVHRDSHDGLGIFAEDLERLKRCCVQSVQNQHCLTVLRVVLHCV